MGDVGVKGCAERRWSAEVLCWRLCHGYSRDYRGGVLVKQPQTTHPSPLSRHATLSYCITRAQHCAAPAFRSLSCPPLHLPVLDFSNSVIIGLPRFGFAPLSRLLSSLSPLLPTPPCGGGHREEGVQVEWAPWPRRQAAGQPHSMLAPSPTPRTVCRGPRGTRTPCHYVVCRELSPLSSPPLLLVIMAFQWQLDTRGRQHGPQQHTSIATNAGAVVGRQGTAAAAPEITWVGGTTGTVSRRPLEGERRGNFAPAQRRSGGGGGRRTTGNSSGQTRTVRARQI